VVFQPGSHNGEATTSNLNGVFNPELTWERRRPSQKKTPNDCEEGLIIIV
jgi:hypothetical protein